MNFSQLIQKSRDEWVSGSLDFLGIASGQRIKALEELGESFKSSASREFWEGNYTDSETLISCHIPQFNTLADGKFSLSAGSGCHLFSTERLVVIHLEHRKTVFTSISELRDALLNFEFSDIAYAEHVSKSDRDGYICDATEIVLRKFEIVRVIGFWYKKGIFSLLNSIQGKPQERARLLADFNLKKSLSAETSRLREELSSPLSVKKELKLLFNTDVYARRRKLLSELIENEERQLLQHSADDEYLSVRSSKERLDRLNANRNLIRRIPLALLSSIALVFVLVVFAFMI